MLLSGPEILVQVIRAKQARVLLQKDLFVLLIDIHSPQKDKSDLNNECRCLYSTAQAGVRDLIGVHPF